MLAWLRKLFAPAPLPTASLYGTEYDIASTFPDLRRTMTAGRPAMYRFKCTAYWPVIRELGQLMETAFGKDSPEWKAVLSSPLICPKCTTLFPDMWAVKASLFGGTGAPCPKCGNDEALLAFVVYRPEDITAADVTALNKYWHSKGQEHEEIERKLATALEELKKNPYYFGTNELWLARNYVSQNAAESAKPRHGYSYDCSKCGKNSVLTQQHIAALETFDLLLCAKHNIDPSQAAETVKVTCALCKTVALVHQTKLKRV